MFMHKRHLLPVVFVLMTLLSYGQRSEDYTTIIEDGAWCWFSDPRAVYYDGDSPGAYIGSVNSKGDVSIHQWDYETNRLTTHTIAAQFQRDDHVNPSILVLPDGRIMVFFTRHNGNLYFTKSIHNVDITGFAPLDSLEVGGMACYTNPVLLTEEQNRIYLFFRGGYDWKPTYIFSDDLGESWSSPRTFVSKRGIDLENRPYTKVYSDGKSSIHFAFTDGHPREENHNSIYYLKYKQGRFYEATGRIIGDTSSLPILKERIPKIYDGVESNARGWIWDIAAIGDGHPVVVFSRLPEETNHEYYYGIWNGEEWINQKLCDAGSAFPRFTRSKSMRDPEPHYSGGITLDHMDPRVVYLSRPEADRFEIEKWVTSDSGNSFTRKKMTKESLEDNVRPFVIRYAPEGRSPRLLWMQNRQYEHYTNFDTRIKGDRYAPKFSWDLDKETITGILSAVADWQMEHFDLVKHHHLDWTNGALYSGMMAWSKVSEDQKYLRWLENLGWRYGWQPHKRMYHADDVVVCQMYLDMYRMKENQENSYRILGPTLARINYVLDHPSRAILELDYSNATTLERWSWCDALFMAPPVYVKLAKIMNDDRYLEYMDKEFKVTYDYLYDQEDHLFYRDHRYFPDKIREANGKKVFWGRGNGWVMGGLVAILKDLPKNSTYRPFYEQLFRDMADKIAKCQDITGFWHASLLDPESFPNPETSSSAFFTYALAYGINAGLLDQGIYEPIVRQGWMALVAAVHPDGKLGWVQPIGQDPKEVTYSMTEVYGVGAFLLAGTELLQLITY